jgi:hypothetical protein
MKKLFMLVAVAGLALSAQAEDNGWGLFGTYWKPSDGDGTAGPGARITAELFPDALLDVRVSNFNDLLDDGDLDVMPIDLGFTLQFPLSKTIGLHAGAGVGYYLADGEGADFHRRAVGGVGRTESQKGQGQQCTLHEPPPKGDVPQIPYVCGRPILQRFLCLITRGMMSSLGKMPVNQSPGPRFHDQVGRTVPVSRRA